MKTRLNHIFFFLLCIITSVNAQYRNIHCIKSPNVLCIEQIDFLENTTLLHMRYHGNGDIYNFYHFNYLEETYIEIIGDTKKYHLLNSYNVPINRGDGEWIGTRVENPTFEHTFTLEFEKIPESKPFNVIEKNDDSDAFNFFNVSYDQNQKSELLNIQEYTESYPMKIYGYYIHDNNRITYYWHNGLLISLSLFRNRDYGNYWEVQFNIKNFSGKSILFDPNLITAYIVHKPSKPKERRIENLKVFSYAEYSKKVRRRQTWESIGFGLAQGLSTLGAGYSSSTTTYSGTSTTNANAYAYGTGGFATSYGSSYTSSHGVAHTTSYNGAAAYAAQQMASQNTMLFNMQQFEIREKLQSGYAKTNTIRDGAEYSGHINIQYKKTDNLRVTIRIGNEDYFFQYIWSSK